jgi:quinol monooxygenase YgiN
MIHAMVRMEIEPARLSEALEILHFFAGRVRAKPGCVDCRIYQDAEDRHVIMLFECWSDPEKLHHHLRSRDYQNVLLVMEMARSVPDISFNAIAHTTGVETIELARLGHQADAEDRAAGRAG